MREKIVLIGAGSAVFTSGLIADLIRLNWTADVALVDVDPSALDVAYRLAHEDGGGDECVDHAAGDD